MSAPRHVALALILVACGGSGCSGALAPPPPGADPETAPKARPWIAYKHPIAERVAPIFDLSIAVDGSLELTDSYCTTRAPVTAQLTPNELAELRDHVSSAKLTPLLTDHAIAGEGDPYVGAPELVLAVTENGHTMSSRYIRFKAPAGLVAVGDLLERFVDSHRMLKSAARSNGSRCWCGARATANDVACK